MTNDQIIQAPHPLQSPHVNSNAWGMHPFLLLLHMQNQNHPPILQNKAPTCSYPHMTALNGKYCIKYVNFKEDNHKYKAMNQIITKYFKNYIIKLNNI